MLNLLGRSIMDHRVFAGNISSIATVLDVFTLNRSKAGGSQDDAPNLQTNRYMN